MENPFSNIILLVINCLQGGGAEKSVLTLAQGFFELGYQVHVLRFKSTVEYSLSENIEFHVLKFKPYKLIPSEKLRYQLFARAVDNYVKKHIGKPILTISNLERADNVLAYSQLPNIVHVIRNTVSAEIDYQQQKGRKVDIAKLRKVYRQHPCIGISEGVSVDFRQVLGLDNITTIYNPIDADLINQLAEEFPVDKQREQTDFIVHVGSFKYQKAHDTLLKAYAKSSKKYPLYLIGQGKLLEESQQLVKALSIDKQVKFLGFQPNPYPYMKQAKLLVLSSRFEGFGRVIAEALAVGTPVISTNCPYGPSELLLSANLTPVDDVAALAELLTQAMAQPQQFSVPFDEQFLPKNIARQYIELIEKI